MTTTHASSISFNELVNDMYISDTGYHFFHIIRAIDKPPFLNELEKHTSIHNAIYKYKSMWLSDWLAIMREIKSHLFSQYNLYRYAYKGESQGKRIISPILTNEHAVVSALGVSKEQDIINWIKYTTWLSPSYVKPATVSILLHDCKMTEMNSIHPLKWTNFDFPVKNERY